MMRTVAFNHFVSEPWCQYFVTDIKEDGREDFGDLLLIFFIVAAKIVVNFDVLFN